MMSENYWDESSRVSGVQLKNIMLDNRTEKWQSIQHRLYTPLSSQVNIKYIRIIYVAIWKTTLILSIC